MIKKLLSKLYILGLMVLTIFFMIIIWKVTFGHLVDVNHVIKRVEAISKIKEEQKNKPSEASFEEAILEGEERVKHYLGYRVLEEIKLKDHFHHIDFDFKPDKRSYCIECHGDMPHGKVKELRAFGNMHASYIACQTCHVRLEGSEKTGVFKWYDRTSGEIVPSPVKEGVSPGTYGSKIIPFVRINGELQRIDTQERIDFTREYSEQEKTLTDIQKSKAKKIIHKIVSKKPYICEDCHQKEASVLPFEDLGYKSRRIDAFVGTEVIGMIKNYTKFYIPRMLEPGFGSGKQEKLQTDDTKL
jgi:hypothetical protein